MEIFEEAPGQVGAVSYEVDVEVFEMGGISIYGLERSVVVVVQESFSLQSWLRLVCIGALHNTTHFLPLLFSSRSL